MVSLQTNSENRSQHWFNLSSEIGEDIDKRDYIVSNEMN